MSEPLTEELLDDLLEALSLDRFMSEHDLSTRILSDYLNQMLAEKGLERAAVVRMANLNETFGYQIFKGTHRPSRNKVL